MKNPVVAAAAFALGAVLAAPIMSFSADQSEPRFAQGGPDHAGFGAGFAGEEREHDGPGNWMRHWLRGMRDGSPRQHCEERLARWIALRAYVGAKLQLTPQQQPLWDKLQATLQAADAKHDLLA